MASLIVDELLCFLSSQFDKLDRNNIFTVILEFYTLDELNVSKKVLVSECEKIHITDAISEFKKERKNTRSIENIKHKVLKDIFDIWDVADVQKGGAFIFQFVASNPNRLPSVNADKFNLQFLISCMIKLQENVSE